MKKQNMVIDGMICQKSIDCMGAVTVDSIPFLAFAIVQNEKSMKALLECSKSEKQRYLCAYQESIYADSYFFAFFERKKFPVVKLALGLLTLAEKEMIRGKHMEYSVMLLYVLYAGYEAVREVLIKESCINGTWLNQEFMKEDHLLEGISRIVVALFFAQYLEIVVEEDEEHQILLEVMEIYEENFLYPMDMKSFYFFQHNLQLFEEMVGKLCQHIRKLRQKTLVPIYGKY